MLMIEERIIDALDKRETVKLSKRDTVISDRYRLWDTVIARVEDKYVYIYTHGWLTNTTKSRLNAILGHYCDIYVYQKNYIWYVVDGPTTSNFVEGNQYRRVR